MGRETETASTATTTTTTTTPFPPTDEQVALSLLATERKQLQRRRAQAKADEQIAREVQSHFDRQSFSESISSSAGDEADAVHKKAERKRSVEADTEFATLLPSMEDTNLELLRRQRRQQEENDEALALAEQERDRDRRRRKVGLPSAGGEDGCESVDSATAPFLSMRQMQLDELLARTEAARDEIRLELRDRAVEHDEAVARAEQARERAAQDVSDASMAQSLQGGHIWDQRQQKYQQVPPRPREEVGHVQGNPWQSSSHPPPPLRAQASPPQSCQTTSSSSNSQPLPPASLYPQPRATSISELENQLLLSGCTVRDVTDVEEVRKNRECNIHCAACMEPFVLGDRIRTLPCLHVFHARCIDAWICSRGYCPIDQNPCL